MWKERGAKGAMNNNIEEGRALKSVWTSGRGGREQLQTREKDGNMEHEWREKNDLTEGFC